MLKLIFTSIPEFTHLTRIDTGWLYQSMTPSYRFPYHSSQSSSDFLNQKL
ncbi:MAG: hypothetical protein ACLFPH_08955 [Bacteroidales bacterium]